MPELCSSRLNELFASRRIRAPFFRTPQIGLVVGHSTLLCRELRAVADLGVPSPGAETAELEAELEQLLWEQDVLADAEEFARDWLDSVPDDRRIDEALRLRANSMSRSKLHGWKQEVRRIRAEASRR